MKPAASSSGVLIRAAWLTAVAILVPNTLPLLIGAAADQLGLSARELGTLAALYNLGALGVFLSGPLWAHRVGTPRAIRLLAALAVCACLLLCVAKTWAGMACAFLLLGLSMSAVGVPGFLALGRLPNLTRGYAIALLVQLLLAGAVSYVAGAYVVPRWGLAGMAVMLACCVAPCAACSVVTDRCTISAAGGSPGLVTLLPFAAAFVAQLLFISSIYMIWIFMERIAEEARLGAAWIGFSFGVTQLFAIVGVVLAANSARLGGRVVVLLIGTSALGASCILASDTDAIRFFISVAALTIALSALSPIFSATLREVDFTHRLYVLGQASHSAGGVAGSFIAGLIVQFHGMEANLWVTGATALTASALLIAAAAGARRLAPGIALQQASAAHVQDSVLERPLELR